MNGMVHGDSRNDAFRGGIVCESVGPALGNADIDGSVFLNAGCQQTDLKAVTMRVSFQP
jgi:hypothetical protein